MNFKQLPGSRAVDLLQSLKSHAATLGSQFHQRTDFVLQAIDKSHRLDTTSRTKSVPTPAYLEPCYKWLLGNLHDPYPSHEQRQRFSLQTGSSMKDITNWFVSARQRIGWSQLRASCFDRSQRAIVQAASRFWPERAVQHPVEPDLELKFAEIEDNAIALYADKFRPSESMLAVLRRRKQPLKAGQRSSIAAPHGKKRTADDAGMTTSSGRSSKRPMSLAPYYLSTSAPRATRSKKRHASEPVVPKNSSGRHATLSYPISSSPSYPKFGESSLTRHATFANPLKRTHDSQEPIEEKRLKRPRVLPIWPDPRENPRRGHSYHQAASTPSSRCASTSALPMPTSTRRNYRRAVSDPTAMAAITIMLEPACIPDLSCILPSTSSSSSPQHAASLFTPPSSPSATDYFTPSSTISSIATMESPPTQWDTAIITSPEAYLTSSAPTFDTLFGSPAADAGSLDTEFTHPCADIDWDALLSQPFPGEQTAMRPCSILDTAARPYQWLPDPCSIIGDMAFLGTTAGVTFPGLTADAIVVCDMRESTWDGEGPADDDKSLSRRPPEDDELFGRLLNPATS